MSNEIVTILTYVFHLIVNIPIFIMLLIGFFQSFSRTIQKSSKVFFGSGILLMMFGLVPTIIVLFGIGGLANTPDLGYQLSMAALFSGDLAALLLFGAGYVRERSLLTPRQKRRILISMVTLLFAWANGAGAAFVPNWGILISMLFTRWFFELITCVMLLITMKSLRVRKDRRTRSGRIENIGLYLIEAQTIRADLVKLLNRNKNLRQELGELEPLLDKSVSQVKLLVGRHKEALQFMKANPAKANAKKLKELEHKESTATNELVKKEYQHAISEHQKTAKSYNDLNGQVEVIELRVASAVSSMEKLKTDALQLKNMDTIIEPPSLKELRVKTEDTSQFIKDYKEAFEELDNM